MSATTLLNDAITQALSYDRRNNAQMRDSAIDAAYDCGMPVAFVDRALSVAGFETLVERRKQVRQLSK